MNVPVCRSAIGLFAFRFKFARKIIQSCEVETAGRNLRASFECKCPDFMEEKKKREKRIEKKKLSCLPRQSQHLNCRHPGRDRKEGQVNFQAVSCEIGNIILAQN